MKYLDVTMEEATTLVDKGTEGAVLDTKTGEYYILKAGYEKWAYVFKQILPDTKEEIEKQLYESTIKVKEAEILRRQAIAELETEKIAVPK